MTETKTQNTTSTPVDTPSAALQESILAVLVFDEKWGAVIADKITPLDFDEPGNEIAEAVLEYRKKYGKPPGDVHLADLFGKELQGSRSRLQTMLRDIAVQRSSLNGEFVADQIGEFLREQKLKAAILAASARYEQRGEGMATEVEAILRDGLANSPPPAGKIEVINLATVDSENPEWLWRDRIPRGQHITVTGLPFVGKSLLMLWFAAQYSRGRPNPDGTPAPRGRVILLSREDAIKTAIKPRLKALGAGMSRIDIIGMIRTDKNKERGFLLAEDLQELESLIRQRPDTLMVGIDPITAYVGSGKIDSHKATDVRSVLEPLNKLAENTGVLVLSITHPAKSSQSALNAFVGSQAFIAVPRLGYLAAKELDDNDRETGRVLFSCVGSNSGKKPNTLAYRTEETFVEPDKQPDPKLVRRRIQEYLDSEPNATLNRRRYLRYVVEQQLAGAISIGKLVWDDVQGIDISADAVLKAGPGRGDAFTEAVTFLRIFLKDGARPSNEVAAEAELLGISAGTLKRAKKKICRIYPIDGVTEKDRWWCELLGKTGEK